MKQTAVEWLMENLKVILPKSQFNDVVIKNVIEQAKEMEEKQQQGHSEEEVFSLTQDSVNLGMSIRQDQLNGYSKKSAKELHKEWFEQVKKK